ncbi:hypothetical protein AKO1_005548, partial [Acrasis kona]
MRFGCRTEQYAVKIYQLISKALPVLHKALSTLKNDSNRYLFTSDAFIMSNLPKEQEMWSKLTSCHESPCTVIDKSILAQEFELYPKIKDLTIAKWNFQLKQANEIVKSYTMKPSHITLLSKDVIRSEYNVNEGTLINVSHLGIVSVVKKNNFESFSNSFITSLEQCAQNEFLWLNFNKFNLDWLFLNFDSQNQNNVVVDPKLNVLDLVPVNQNVVEKSELNQNITISFCVMLIDKINLNIKTEKLSIDILKCSVNICGSDPRDYFVSEHLIQKILTCGIFNISFVLQSIGAILIKRMVLCKDRDEIDEHFCKLFLNFINVELSKGLLKCGVREKVFAVLQSLQSLVSSSKNPGSFVPKLINVF